MYVEYEATFANVDKKQVRDKLKKIGGKLLKAEFLQRRITFSVPENTFKHSWARVRDESDRVTMSFKANTGNGINDQKEIELIIDNFQKGVDFLKKLGCKKKSYQETKREIWDLERTKIFIDEWPFVPPFVEIEGTSEKEVKIISEKLGFNYAEALFCPVGTIYSKQYGVSEKIINNEIPKITFDMKNPFIKFLKNN